jgi:cobalt-zinc-cadmium efflux system protein
MAESDITQIRINNNPPNQHHHDISWGRRLSATMAMNLVIPVVQIYGGLISGSMALISDAIHNLSDFTTVLISYIALKMGGKAPDIKQTFGYRRLEVFAAVFNVALLLGAGFYIAIESWQRFQNPTPIKGQLVIWIASIAFLANMVSTGMLHSGSKENINIRGAFLHMLTDALMSLGILMLGIVWLYKPWYWLDPVFSWVIVAIIVYSSWDILKEAFLIFMNATPPGIDIEAIQKEIETMEGVKEIHHLHVWNLSQNSMALAVHILTEDKMLSEVDKISMAVRDMLLCKFNIDHPVLQFETNHVEENGILCCPTNDHKV